jgi:hypothetical protein
LPSIAVPTTSIKSSRSRILGISLRMSAESSTTSTRTRLLVRLVGAGLVEIGFGMVMFWSVNHCLVKDCDD